MAASMILADRRSKPWLMMVHPNKQITIARKYESTKKSNPEEKHQNSAKSAIPEQFG
jgi:hypothetical protein